MEEGKFVETDKGTPRGGVLSPLLADVCLHHVLAPWYEKVIGKEPRGYAEIVRYADDFIVLIQREKEATFDFPSFTRHCDKTRYGKFKSGRKTAKIKFRQKTEAMNERLKEVRNLARLKEWWKALRLKPLGHYRCYGTSGNVQELRKFHNRTSRLAHKRVNELSRNKSCTHKRYCSFKKYDPLPEPKTYHPTHTLSTAR